MRPALVVLLVLLATIYLDSIHSWCYYNHRYHDWVFVEVVQGFGGELARNYYFGPAEYCQ